VELKLEVNLYLVKVKSQLVETTGECKVATGG